jgi:hypothetical protein
MRTDLEVAIVRASCNSGDNQELYWIFSRSQLEFVSKELDRADDSISKEMARYQDVSLPVISLEQHFGYIPYNTKESPKYMVLCGVDRQKKIRKVIVTSDESPKFFKLNRSFAALDTFVVPKSHEHVLGAYSLGKGKIGIVPDVVGVGEEFV